MAELMDTNGRILNGLYANEMRMSMENKNLLATKGAIYVGNGRTSRVTNGERESDIPVTVALNPPNSSGYFLTTDPNDDCGLKWNVHWKVIEVTEETSAGGKTWSASSDGKASFQVTFSKPTDYEGTIGLVQLMASNDNRITYTVTNAIIDITENSITIYSNIKVDLKIFLILV